MLRAGGARCETGFHELNGLTELLAARLRPWRAAAAVLALGLTTAPGPAQGEELMEPGQAFRFEARMADPETLEVTWRIAEDHYMYRQAFSVTAPEGGVALGAPAFPEGKVKHDEFFGEVVVYDSDVTFTLPVTPIANGLSRFIVEAVGQGCNEPVGVCYPPVTRTATIELAAARSTAPQSLMSPSTNWRSAPRARISSTMGRGVSRGTTTWTGSPAAAP